MTSSGGAGGSARAPRWMRILLCGLVAGVVWYVLAAIVLVLVGEGLLEAVETARSRSPAGAWFFFCVDLAMGVWAIWLYAVLRPGHRSAPRAAVVAGSAWWLIKSLQSAKFVGLGVVPAEAVLLPFLATLPAMIAAVMVGAWLYGQ